jgi:hypothetical protein
MAASSISSFSKGFLPQILDDGGLMLAGDFKKEKYEFKVGTKSRDFTTADPIFTRVGPAD